MPDETPTGRAPLPPRERERAPRGQERAPLGRERAPLGRERAPLGRESPPPGPERAPRGRATVGRAVGKSALPEQAVTGIIKQDLSSTEPIFVDPSGTRRRRLRLVAYAIGVLLILVVVTVWASQLLGPVTPPPAPPAVSAS